ncbi:MAG: fibronectin type III domain-containing protein [Candidatus Nanopelagicales bacterium]
MADISLGSGPLGSIDATGIAYKDNPAGDDYVYVADNRGTTISIINARTNTVTGTISGLPAHPLWIALGQDDSAYVSFLDYASPPGTIARLNLKTNLLDDTLVIGGQTTQLAVHSTHGVDDTVYVANDSPGIGLTAVNANSLDDTVALDSSIRGWGVVVVDDTVFAGSNSGTLSVFSANTPAPGTSISLPGAPMLLGANVEDSKIYAASSSGDVYSVDIATGLTDVISTQNSFSFTPAYDPVNNLLYVTNLTDPSLSVIDAGTNTLIENIPFPQNPFGVAVSPAGDRVYVSWWSTVTVIRVGPPPPPPTYPPGAPTDVRAVAGDTSATVSWNAPADTGSFPVTDYEVQSSPAGGRCLSHAPALSCTVPGLVNGRSYDFVVRALNGAGWGAPSLPSNPVTPSPAARPTIMIVGSRDAVNPRAARVTGRTTDLVGTRVTPWVRFPGQAYFTAGSGVQTVAADGTFSWQRTTGRKIYVYFRHEGTQSNTVAIAAR